MKAVKNMAREAIAPQDGKSSSRPDLTAAVDELQQYLPTANIADFHALAPVGYFTLTSSGLIHDVNPTGAKLLYTKRQQLLNKPFAQFVAKKHRNRLNLKLKISEDEQAFHRCDLKLRKSTGKFFYARTETRVLHDPFQKETTRWLVTVTDISAIRRAKDDVRRGKRFLEKVLESLTHPFFVVNVDDYSVQLANTAALKDRSSARLTCFALLHQRATPCEGAEYRCPLREVKKTRKPVTVEHVHRDFKGNIRHFEIHGYPIFDSHGRVSQVIEYTIDITPRKQMEEALRSSQESFRNVVLANQTGMIVTNREGVVLFANPTAQHFIGCEEGEKLEGQLLGIPIVTGQELDIVRLGGCTGVAELRVKNTEWERQPAHLIVLHDITDRKEAEAAVEHMAYHDPLTGLPNRQMYRERLNEALARAKRNRQLVAVLFLDLDRFKIINDTLGHTVGDQCLKEAGKRLLRCVRDTDMVARLGGDEFTILLEGLEKIERVRRVCNEVVASLNRPFHINGEEFFSPASIGVSCYPGDGDDEETLIKQADTAMYHAKASGKNNVQFYTHELGVRITEFMNMENSLRRALDRNEFRLFYQPQVDINSGDIVGLEALLRWAHPERGLVAPSEFIHSLEETGLIISVSDWALRTACAQNKEWQDAGLPAVRVAVNLSARNLHSVKIVGTIARALEWRGLDPRYLELEITESMLMPDNKTAVTLLSELSRMNVQITLDDFGTGYSSLSYLKHFPVDRLKIDRSFIQGIPDYSNDAAIAASIIAMAHALGFKVVAEGVETQEQLTFLRAQQCDEMQGYLISRPVPAEQIRVMLEQRQRLHSTCRKGAGGRAFMDGTEELRVVEGRLALYLSAKPTGTVNHWILEHVEHIPLPGERLRRSEGETIFQGN